MNAYDYRALDDREKIRAFTRTLCEKYYPRYEKELRKAESDKKYHQMSMEFDDTTGKRTATAHMPVRIKR